MSGNIFSIFPEMSLNWRFESNGDYCKPVIVLEEKYRYILSSQTEETSQYECVGGCGASVSVLTSEEEDHLGWSVCSKHLVNISPLHLHTCHGVIQMHHLTEALAGFHINR